MVLPPEKGAADGEAGGTAGHERDLCALDLVDSIAAELLDGFANVGHTNDVCLGQMAAVGVHGDLAAEASVALGDERSALTDGTEAVVLELHDHEWREVVVEQRHVDVVRSDAGHLEHPPGDRSMAGRGEV